MRILAVLSSLCLVTAAAAVRPTNLRCEYRLNPLGIDVPDPRLSWMVTTDDPKARDVKQSAYRILVASTEANLRSGKGDLWDTGRVESDASVHVAYAGKKLGSGQAVYWKVQIWDGGTAASPWSESANWSMGLLDPKDWHAKWIGLDENGLYKNPASPYGDLAKAKWIWGASSSSGPAQTQYFRTSFVASTHSNSVRLIVGSDDRGDIFLNGERIGSTGPVNIPAVWDIAQRLRPGKNVLAVATKKPRNRAPGLIASVNTDGHIEASGATWRTASTVQPGWEKPGFDDSAWQQASELGGYGMAPWGEIGYKEEHALPARLLRKEFDAPRGLRRATVYMSGQGSSELYINGTRISDDVLSPGLTDYDKHVLYVTRDVTKQITGGKNAIAVQLGNGRFYAPREREPFVIRSYGVPRLLLNMRLEFEDGSSREVVSDETWKASANGPIRANNEFDGEEYDARMEIPNWNRPGFDAASWRAADILPAPKGQLVPQMAEPLRVIETIRPVHVNEVQRGVFIYDMGQNMVGWCRLKVSGPKGTQVSLRHAETLRPDGTLYLDNLRSARATDLYTLKGSGEEVYEPRFTYHGFRYVEVRGYPGKPPLTAIEGRVVHDAMQPAGTFVSSNALLNRLHKNIYWGIRGNYRSIPTDCPQRDERQGWLGDRSTVSRSESYLFDVAAFYTKWERDIADAQRETGSIPDVAPNYWAIYNDDVTWPSTFLLVPTMLYDQYGDTRVIAKFYPEMKKWVEHMRGFIHDGIMTKDTYGDWCVPPESKELIHSQDPARKTKGALLSTAYFIQMLRLMSRYATMVQQPLDASEYEALAGRMRTAFQREFFKADSQQYDNGTQTSSILPLMFGITPEASRAAVFEGLVRRIQTESNNHVGTGLVGAQWLMRTLSDYGRPDLAYTIATQTTYPGWGYMLEKGATTIWELWNGDTADPAMNSGNHVMQIGDLNVWFYEYLAGIRPDPAHPGFKHIIIRPYPVEGLDFVKATHKSMYGEIASAWTREGKKISLTVTIPPNTTATVHLGGEKHDVGSGTYTFAAEAGNRSMAAR